MKKVVPLANPFTVAAHSDSPQDIYCYSPGLLALPNGRLVVTMDFGGRGVGRLEGSGPDSFYPELSVLAQILISDDNGKTWKVTGRFPFCHARPFLVGNEIYVLGQHGDLKITRSIDGGETWSEACSLTQGQIWHQAPSNVWYANGNVYLVMERVTDFNTGWPVNAMAPVLMRGKIGSDLLQRENWTFASELVFHRIVREENEEYHGVQFYSPKKDDRYAQPLGWLETQVVQIFDEKSSWFDPSGHTFYLFMRTNTGISNIGAMAKVTENPDGSMTTGVATAPSGKEMILIPLPGGHVKFHILYDKISQYYWLLSNQATDSLKRFDSMPPRRGDPVNERHRLALYFSRNCFDWCFAGIAALTDDENAARSYASMAIQSEDLLILSRSGDDHAKDNHDTNLITLHRVENFRELVY